MIWRYTCLMGQSRSNTGQACLVEIFKHYTSSQQIAQQDAPPSYLVTYSIPSKQPGLPDLSEMPEMQPMESQTLVLALARTCSLSYLLLSPHLRDLIHTCVNPPAHTFKSILTSSNNHSFVYLPRNGQRQLTTETPAHSCLSQHYS
jgi:hypothetical protein